MHVLRQVLLLLSPLASQLRFSRLTLLRLTLLVGAAVLVWIAQHGLWSAERWRVPLQYRSDALEMLGRIQAAAEGTGVPLVPQVVRRLGAPFEAPWNDYPASDKVLVVTLGALSRWVGVAAAANLGLVLGLALGVISFYGCARLLRLSPTWAAVGALLFACSYGTFSRGLAHMLLVFNWTLPPALLACAWVAGRAPLRLRSSRGWFSLAAAAVLGLSNPYNLYFWLQLIGWAVIAQWFGARRRGNLTVGLGCIAVAGVAFFIANAEVWLYPTDAAARDLVERNYGGTEKYALKPIELVVPPGDHRVPALAFFGHRYVRWSDWRGENLMPYLGLVGVLGLAWLTIVAVRRALRGQRLPGPALQVAWLVAFSSVGGITNLLAFFAEVQVFRATSRVSFILLPIILLFLGRQATRLTARWSPGRRWALAGLVVVIGLVDQVPRPAAPEQRAMVAAQYHADQAFGAELERELGAGAKVFQLPVFGFLEAPDRHDLGNYEHLRLYLATETLRLSFGVPKYRAMNEWQHELETLPVGEMVHRLEASGFSAVVIGRRGYADEGRDLLNALDRLGRPRLARHASGDWVAFRLQPAAAPALPLARQPTLAAGWHRQPVPDATGRPIWWTYGSAVMNYFNPRTQPLVVDLRMRLRAAGDRDVEVRINGENVRQVALPTDAEREVTARVSLEPGSNRLDLVTPQPPLRRSQQRRALQAIGLVDVVVTPVEDAGR